MRHSGSTLTDRVTWYWYMRFMGDGALTRLRDAGESTCLLHVLLYEENSRATQADLGRGYEG